MNNESVRKFEINGEEVILSGETVRKYLTRGGGNVTDQEVVMFINLCKYQKLNPFLNEAYLIKFGNSPATQVTGKEAYMKKADAQPTYDGLKAGIIVQRGKEIIELEGAFCLKGDILLGGWAQVFRSDRKYPFCAKVDLEEYTRYKKDGTIQSMWEDKKKSMIRKVAIVQAQREAFPAALGAMYVAEEVENIEPKKDGIFEPVEKEDVNFEPDVEVENAAEVEKVTVSKKETIAPKQERIEAPF